jgi:hypothetical protein
VVAQAIDNAAAAAAASPDNGSKTAANTDDQPGENS